MDIIYDNYFAPYAEQQLVLPLRDYFQRDSVDTKIWNSAQYALYDTPSGPKGIPVYTGTTAYAVNQTLFDKLGYTYPSPDWTAQDFLTVSRQVTQVGKGRAFGSNIFWYTSGANQQASWVFRAFGGHQVSPTGAPSQLSSAQNVAALRWLYEGLFWPKIGAPQDAIGTADFVGGRLGLLMMSTWELLSFAMTLKGPSVKWDFLPNPVFPAGRATFCTADFYAIAANTQHPAECWDLLRWVSVEPDWQRATFKYSLRSPALNALWDEWAQTVQAVVPFFAGKNFSWFGDAASKGYAYPVDYYPHDDQRVWGLIGQYFTQLYDQKISSVEAGASQIDHVVNGFEAAVQANQAQLARAGQRFPTDGPAIASVPAGV